MIQFRSAQMVGLIAALITLIALCAVSVVVGYTSTSWLNLVDSLRHFDGSNEQIIIRDLRIPRALTAAITGSSLAVSGAIMQSITRNPMASPGLLGINAGAGFFVVLGITMLSVSVQREMIWFAFAGAAVAAIMVYVVGRVGLGGLTPLKLTLAGATLAALFSSFTSALLVVRQTALETVLFWLSGSVADRKLENLLPVVPFMALGLIIALLLGRSLNVLDIGEDVAKGLGQRVGVVKLISLLAVVLLAGGAVAVAGPVGFVGLVIPHLVRRLIGKDNRWVIPYSAVLGAMLLVLADIGARFIIFPKEVPVGVMTAMVGAPFFIWMAVKEVRQR